MCKDHCYPLVTQIYISNLISAFNSMPLYVHKGRHLDSRALKYGRLSLSI